MAGKVRDYGKLARDIRDAVGESNIVSAAHCATRLRLVLKESPSAEVTKEISGMPPCLPYSPPLSMYWRRPDWYRAPLSF